MQEFFTAKLDQIRHKLHGVYKIAGSEYGAKLTILTISGFFLHEDNFK